MTAVHVVKANKHVECMKAPGARASARVSAPVCSVASWVGQRFTAGMYRREYIFTSSRQSVNAEKRTTCFSMILPKSRSYQTRLHAGLIVPRREQCLSGKLGMEGRRLTAYPGRRYLQLRCVCINFDTQSVMNYTGQQSRLWKQA